MNDAQLFGLVISALNTGLTTQGLIYNPDAQTGVIVRQGYQPTQQGTPSVPSINLHKISDQRYGFLKRKDIYDGVTGQTNHTEEQAYITTLQINALAIVNPSDVAALTAADYLNIAVAIMQSDVSRAFWHANGLDVERIRVGRVVWFTDDKGRNEADPSYDCSFVHTQVISSVTPATATVIPNLVGIQVNV